MSTVDPPVSLPGISGLGALPSAASAPGLPGIGLPGEGGALPHEIVLGANAVPSPGPGVTGVPYASPGVGSTLLAPPGLPHVDFEPTLLAAAMIKLAGQAFGGGLPGSSGLAPTVPTQPFGSVALAPPVSPSPSGAGGAPEPTPSSVPAPSAPALTSPSAPPEGLGAALDGVLASPFSEDFRLPLVEPAHSTASGPYFAEPLNLGGADPYFAEPIAPAKPEAASNAGSTAKASDARPKSESAPAGLGSTASGPTGLSVPYQIDTELVPEPRPTSGSLFDAHAVRREFPILEERIYGKRLVWLDNAATTQKPRAVIDRLTRYYERENSNIHRAAHTLAARATDAYESARESTRRFLNASSTEEIIFVRGATEGINLVAQTYGRRHVGAGDEIVITWLEHHANIVPWQMLCHEKGARLKIAPVDDRGQIILEEYEKLLGPKTKLVSLTQVSNALGTITPAAEMVAMAHRHGARVLVDGAQSVSHRHTDVQELDADFFVFSGHKVFAPTGIGAVYGKREVLEHLPPWQGGGNMIQDVTFERTRYQPPPARFEAGTGSIGDAAGLGAALDWLMRLGLPNVERYEHELLTYATRRLGELSRVKIIGTAPDKAGVVSFVVDGVRTEDVSAALDKEGIAVRSGHHCAQPILRRFGLEATVRASFAPYNLCEDIDALVDAVSRL
jgi:cysteine desulfurase / selenocysteine lyase